MKVQKVTLQIPYSAPQTITIVEGLPGNYRTTIIDKYDRIEPFIGESLGFDIVVFRSTIYSRVSRLVVKGNWDEAKYRGFNGFEHDVVILKVDAKK